MAESMIFTLEMFEDAQKYWVEKLCGELTELNLVGDFPTTTGAHQANEAVHNISFGTTISETLFRISKNNDVALYIILAAAFKVLLFKFTGQTDIIVTSPTLKESQQNYNKFVALRDHLEPGMTFKEFLMKARETAVQGYKKQFYPIRKLMKFLNIETPSVLFKVMILLDTIHHQYALAEIRNDFKNDILVSFGKNDGMLKGEVIYNSGLYKPETLHRLSDCYLELLNFTLKNMDSEISRIDIFSEEEKRRILFDFNNTSREFPQDKPLHELFEEQAARTPDLKAVIDIGTAETESSALTYLQLNEKSHQLARLLREKGVQNETLVAVLAEPSIEMILGLLAILKTGAAYLPIDPYYPEERIKYMLADGMVKFLVKKGNNFRTSWKGQVEPESIVLDLGHWDFKPVSNHQFDLCGISNFNSSSLAYIMYTSGSTGKPKGVMVKHRNVVRLVKNPNYIHLEQGERLLLTGVMTFDITTFEIWAPLLNGLSLYLANENTILDPQRLGEALAENKISILHLVPQLLNQIAAWNTDIFRGLRYLLVGGDLVKPQYINELRNKYEGLHILHMYGPTENTTFTTYFPIEKNYETGIPIGKPVSNTSVYILDRCGQLVPVGAVGELFTGGEGIARGYLNNPELTYEKFKSFNRSYRSYKSYISNKLYKTGDLARWLPNGNIEFLGRMDQQVKIRGIRIEPGEIERLLLKLPQVQEAVVIARKTPTAGSDINKDEKAEKHLCAYIVSDQELNISELKNYLAGHLPTYMLPQYYDRVPKMPLTPNGKLDYRALPVPQITVEERYIPPADELEEKLVAIWAEVLEIEKDIIGVHTSFFDLGGHSLKATILTSKIHKELDIKLPLTEIFKTPTIHEQGAYIKKTVKNKYESLEPVEKKEYYELSSAQKRLYVLQQMMPDSTAYNILTIISFEKSPDKKKLEQTFIKLINRHESLRTSFKIVKDEPVQQIHDGVEFELEENDRKEAPRIHHSSLIIHHFISPFDLSKAPLLRVGLIKLLHTPTAPGGHPRRGTYNSQEGKKDKYLLIVDMHHIISDGISDNILKKDFTALYRGEKLPLLRLHYKDFAGWQNSREVKNTIKSQELYWLRQFEQEIPILNVPIDFPRQPGQGFEGKIASFVINPDQTTALKSMASKLGATTFITLLAIFNILLSKLSSQEDIVIGVAVAGRRHADLEKIIGMFVNILALRNFPSREQTFREFLKDVKQRTLEAFENQDYQYETLVEQLALNRDTNRNPLFDMVFGFIDTDAHNAKTAAVPRQRVTAPEPGPYAPENTTAKFDLALSGIARSNSLFLAFEYRTELYKKETIQRFFLYFKEILCSVIKNPDSPLGEIELIGEEQSKELLEALQKENPRKMKTPQKPPSSAEGEFDF